MIMSARVRKGHSFVRLIVKTAKISMLMARRLLSTASSERTLCVTELIVNVLRGNLKISDKTKKALSKSKMILRKLSENVCPSKASELFHRHYKTVVFFLKQCLPYLERLLSDKNLKFSRSDTNDVRRKKGTVEEDNRSMDTDDDGYDRKSDGDSGEDEYTTCSEDAMSEDENDGESMIRGEGAVVNSWTGVSSSPSSALTTDSVSTSGHAPSRNNERKKYSNARDRTRAISDSECSDFDGSTNVGDDESACQSLSDSESDDSSDGGSDYGSDSGSDSESDSESESESRVRSARVENDDRIAEIGTDSYARVEEVRDNADVLHKPPSTTTTTATTTTTTNTTTARAEKEKSSL